MHINRPDVRPNTTHHPSAFTTRPSVIQLWDYHLSSLFNSITWQAIFVHSAWYFIWSSYCILFELLFNSLPFIPTLLWALACCILGDFNSIAHTCNLLNGKLNRQRQQMQFWCFQSDKIVQYCKLLEIRVHLFVVYIFYGT